MFIVIVVVDAVVVVALLNSWESWWGGSWPMLPNVECLWCRDMEGVVQHNVAASFFPSGHTNGRKRINGLIV
jgi:hypothetical protein